MLNVNLKKEVMSNLENAPSRLFKFQEWADTKLHHQDFLSFFLSFFFFFELHIRFKPSHTKPWLP